VLLVLVLGISCGFTTAYTFPFSKLSKAKKLAAHYCATLHPSALRCPL
jgi:hypothetical protein